MRPKQFLMLLVVVTALFAAVPAYAETLTYAPLNQIVNLGDQAVVNVIFDTPVVGDFDVVVSWNPSILSFYSLVWGTQLGDPLTETWNDMLLIGTSSLEAAMVSYLTATELSTLQGAGPVTFFTLTFNTLTTGTSLLDFSAPGAVSYIPIGNENGDQRIFDADQGSITVTAGTQVPEPAGLLLLSSGLLAMMGFLRRLT